MSTRWRRPRLNGLGYRKESSMCDNSKVLEIAGKYAKPEDKYEWRLYWRDLGEVLVND
jgi:hypothetical protein